MIGIVWTLVVIGCFYQVGRREIAVEPNIDYKAYISHNPEWVQDELKNWDIKFVNQLDNCYGLTNFDTNEIKVLIPDEEELPELEGLTLLHEIGHVVNSKKHFTSDKEFQELWEKYGKKMILTYGIDDTMDEETKKEILKYSSDIEEGAADLYSYVIVANGKDKLNAGIQPLFDYMWERIQ